MNKVVFTIVARNYVGLANVLAKSIFAANQHIEMYVFIADELTEKPSQLDNVIYLEAKRVLDIAHLKWVEMAFKYDLTEFCTSIKPACFNYLFNIYSDDTKIIYFDPDVFVFSSLDLIFNDLTDNFMILTPHITTIEEEYSGEMKDTVFLGAGVYNLGFLAIRKCQQSMQLITWWHNELTDKCFIDKFDQMFTDQKWMNFITCFFDNGVLISRDLGRNIAPWNYYERKLVRDGAVFNILNRIGGCEKTLLQFAHFSGLDYKNLSITKNKNVPSLRYSEYDDLLPIFAIYKKALSDEQVEKNMSLRYTYNYYSNNTPVLSIHRRIFRRLIETSLPQDPFDCKGEFFMNLVKNRLLFSTNEQYVDKINEKDIVNFDTKVNKLNRVFKVLKNIIGFKNYVLLLKFLIVYFRPENQIFLYDRKFLKGSFKK